MDSIDSISDESFFADIFPAKEGDELDWANRREVGDDIRERFSDKEQPGRSLGLAIRRVYGDGQFAIRHRDGKTYVVPRLHPEGEADEAI